jgi:hypothetical protein
MRGNEWSLTEEASTNDRTCQTECSEMEWSVLRTNERDCLQQHVSEGILRLPVNITQNSLHVNKAQNL